jgi:hypothetical protein
VTPTGQEQEAAPVVAANPSKLFMGTEDQPVDDEVKRLRSELQRHKVEEGRVKSLSDQNKALQKELEELRQKVAEGGKGRSPVDHVDPSRRGTIDDEILQAQADMIRGSSKEVLDDVERRVAPIQKALETEHEARIRAESESFDAQIEQLHKGFAAETNPGGKYVDKWTSYLAKVDPRTGLKNGEILSKAYYERRIDGVNTMIDDFKRQHGISRRESMRGAAFPGSTPQNANPGGDGEGDQTRYTLSQYKAELDKSSQDFSSGRITAAEKFAVIQKFKKAASEGRIVRDPSPQVGV